MPLAFKTTLDDSAFVRSLKNMGNQVSNLNEKMEGGVKTGASNFGFLAGGIAAAGYAAVSAVKGIIDFGGNLRDAIDSTDLSAESFQRLSFAFGQSGASQGVFVKGIQNLTISMQAARDGNEKTIKSFAKLGISVDELTSSDEVLLKIADATKNASDKSESLAARLDVLGKAGKAMQAGLKDGAEGLRAMGAEMETLSEDQLNKLDAMGDRLEVWKNRVIAATAANALYFLGGGQEDEMQTRADAAKPQTAKEGIEARKNFEDRQDAKTAQSIKEMAALQQIEYDKVTKASEATLKQREDNERARYKARAEEFKRIDKERMDTAAGYEKVQAQQEYDHKKWIADEAKRAQEIEHDRIMKNLEAQKVFAEEAKERHLDMLKSWLGNEQNKLSAAQQKQQAAKAAAEGALQSGIRGGLQTPAERRAEAMAEKRVAREERRLERILANPDKKIGGKTGDAQRAKELRDARNEVNIAAKEVTLAEKSVDAIAKAIDKLIVKP